MCLHIRELWGLTNLVASMVAELDDTLPRFMDVQWDSVQATQELPIEVFAWKMAIGKVGPGLDPLIVIAKGGHLCCLHGSRVSCCQVISLARCVLI
jgi:hypothetical protein